MNTKIITLLIVGVVALTAAAVFAAVDYNSSRSNTQTAIVDQKIGDILLRYGIGGAEINKVTDALAVGVSKVDLKATLIAIGINEEGVQEVFTELDRLGVGDTTQSAPATGTIEIKDANGGTAVSSSDTEDIPQSATGVIKILTPEREVSAPDAEGTDEGSAEGTSLKAAETGTIKEILPSKRAEPTSNETELIDEIRENDKTTTGAKRSKTTEAKVVLGGIKTTQAIFHDTAMNIIQNIRSAAPEERKNLLDELKVSRGTFQTEILSMRLSIRGNAQELRENFRKTVTIKWSRENGSVAYRRIALAHGKGLRMINRFRSASARFDHILGRLESRIEKLEARGVDVPDVIARIEEAKNMSVENEAKLEELKAKYESLLLGENPQGVAEEAREIAKELKTEVENLHTKLRDIASATRAMLLPALSAVKEKAN